MPKEILSGNFELVVLSDLSAEGNNVVHIDAVFEVSPECLQAAQAVGSLFEACSDLDTVHELLNQIVEDQEPPSDEIIMLASSVAATQAVMTEISQQIHGYTDRARSELVDDSAEDQRLVEREQELFVALRCFQRYLLKVNIHYGRGVDEESATVPLEEDLPAISGLGAAG